MSVVFLGPAESPVSRFLCGQKEEMRQTANRITVEQLDAWGCEFIVSHGYRHIVRGDVLTRYTPCVINLHIALLPWNRGADPNLWSYLEDTPKGFTIHVMDEGVDTGPILLQETLELSEDETLRTSYEKLQKAMFDSFCRHWPDLRGRRIPPRLQEGKGTSHRVKDRAPYMHLLEAKGWDTPILAVKRKALPR